MLGHWTGLGGHHWVKGGCWREETARLGKERAQKYVGGLAGHIRARQDEGMELGRRC
jgi:hypothetical protein